MPPSWHSEVFDVFIRLNYLSIQFKKLKMKNKYVLARELSSWSIVSYPKRLWVRLPIRAHTWVAGLMPKQGAYGRKLIDVSLSLSLSVSLSPALSISNQ